MISPESGSSCGDGLLSYRNFASGALRPQTLLADLREALAARPDLWHAWSAVVQQLVSQNQLDEAWSVVEQATERFPLMPGMWLDRANVCRLRHDAAGELESLQNAYRINPTWSQGARTLCEALQRRGRHEEARKLLELAAARSPLDAANHLMLAESLWQAGQRQPALERIQQLLRIEPGFERAWDLLRTWADAQGCPNTALQTARELVAGRPGEARSWLFLARLLDAPEQLDERLTSLDRALEFNPRLLEAHDLRAVSLASAQRWEEAVAACQPAAWDHHPPMELQARSAWLLAEQGMLPEAIARIRQVVADEPNFYGAWARLADWCSLTQDHAGYLQAAENMVRIDPQHELTFGYLGEARQRSGDRAGALDAYRHAFALNPRYEFAGNALFDLQMEDGDLAAAGETIAALRAHTSDAFVLAREAQLAARQRDFSRASLALEQLCTAPAENPWPLAAAVEALATAGGASQAEAVLERMLADSAVQPEVGRHWADLKMQRGSWSFANRLPALFASNRPVGERAVAAYLQGLADTGQSAAVQSFVHSNAHWLRSSDFTWGSAGSALAGSRAYPAVVNWMRDWRERPGAEPWMLINVVEGLRATGRVKEAIEASHVALRSPSPGAKQLHRLWLAADAAAEGDTIKAGELFSQVDPEKLGPDWALLAACVEGVIAISQATVADRPRTFAQVYGKIENARRGYAAFDREPAHRRAYRRCIWQVAQRTRYLRAWLWYAWALLRLDMRLA